MELNKEELLQKYGWKLNCWSPLTISAICNELDEPTVVGTATEEAADFIINTLRQEHEETNQYAVEETYSTKTYFIDTVLKIEKTAQRLKNKVLAWTEGELPTFGVEISNLLSKTEELAINAGYRQKQTKASNKPVVSVIRNKDKSVLTFKKSKITTIGSYENKYEVSLDGMQDSFIFMKGQYDLSELEQYYLELRQ